MVREGYEAADHPHDGEGLNLQVSDTSLAVALIHGYQRCALLVHIKVLNQACSQEHTNTTYRLLQDRFCMSVQSTTCSSKPYLPVQQHATRFASKTISPTFKSGQ